MLRREAERQGAEENVLGIQKRPPQAIDACLLLSFAGLILQNPRRIKWKAVFHFQMIDKLRVVTSVMGICSGLLSSV